jgi:hypothetical protein
MNATSSVLARLWVWVALGCALVVLVGVGSLPAAARMSGACRWRLVAHPDPVGAELVAVSAASPDDVWAVGDLRKDWGTPILPLAQHWNGRRWSTDSMPAVGGFSLLQGVAAASHDDVWAVGFRVSEPSGNHLTLIEHWNGSGWRIIPSPSPAVRDGSHATDDILYGVTVAARDDVWAVGSRGLASTSATLIEHWNGRRWMIVPSPNPTPRSVGTDELFGVSAASVRTVWAVGYRDAPTAVVALVERWNGQRWIASRVPAGRSVLLAGVAAVSPTQAWAVGRTVGLRPVILHEQNGGWRTVDVAAVPKGDLVGVAASSPTDAWAVETRISGGGPTVVHWDGSSWRPVTTPKLGTGGSSLGAVTGLASGQAWTIGFSHPDPLAQPDTVIEQCVS